jgi:predicted AlkP superfamily phosphohydrolase/phosphomutase
MKNRVLVIGLDGATFDLIKPWISEGKLPNLRRLIDGGSHGTLNSTIPPLSPIAWSSMVTGTNPGKHGIHDFIEREGGLGYKIKFLNASNRRIEPLWTTLHNHGKRSVVINVPLSYPPSKIEHCCISGMDSPATTNVTHPPELYDELTGKLGHYIVEMDRHEGLTDDVPKYLGLVKNAMQNRFDASQYLMEKYEWDFFMVVFVLLDRIQHYYWKHIDPRHPEYDEKVSRTIGNPILDVMAALDDYVGKLIQTAGEGVTTMIVSDHGFGPVYKSVSLNNWLMSKGYLTTNKKQASMNIMGHVRAAVSGMLPNKLKYALKRRLKPSELSLFQNVDWASTLAYAEGASPRIFINNASRNLGGTIQDGEQYGAVRDRLISDLMGLTNPASGESIVDKVYKKEDIFKGDDLRNAPDLIVQFKKGYTNYKKGNIKDQIVLNAEEASDFLKNDADLTGDHLPNGILIMNGPSIKRGGAITDAEIVDIAPTVLYLLDTPIAENLDGKVIAECIDKAFLDQHAAKVAQVSCGNTKQNEEAVYTDDEKESIRNRLQGLGYLD